MNSLSLERPDTMHQRVCRLSLRIANDSINTTVAIILLERARHVVWKLNLMLVGIHWRDISLVNFKSIFV